MSLLERRGTDWAVHASARQRFESLCARRLEREPVQYLVGSWDFHDLTDVLVRPPVLIPRPETETLVDIAVARAQEIVASEPPDGIVRILDVGAGSGVLGLAVLKAVPTAIVVGVDPNPAAVALSRENAARVGENVALRYECVEGGIADADLSRFHPFDLIMSNPPYIPSAEIEGLEPEVRDHEDAGALDGGVDGLDVALEILQRAPQILGTLPPSSGTCSNWQVCMELDAHHPEVMPAWLRLQRDTAVAAAEQGGSGVGLSSAFEWEQVATHADAFGVSRFSCLAIRASASGLGGWPSQFE